MMKLEVLGKERIQVTGIFNLADMYKHAFNWLDWRKYDVEETRYTEKSKPSGKEYKIFWDAIREIDEYSRYDIQVRWYGFGITDVEVMHNGKKVTMQKGEINVYLTAVLETDYENKWEHSPIMSFLRSFYEKYLYKGRIESLKIDLWNEAYEFHNELKAFLDLYKFGSFEH